jgi:hypothetical protein
LFGILSPERWGNPRKKWYWTCFKFSCFDSASHNS